MEHPAPFTRHYAHLVWLLLTRPEDVEDQKAAMRHVLAHSLTRAHEIRLTELNIAVSELAQARPDAVELRWLAELAFRMAGHSVRVIAFETGASATEALGLARSLTLAPVQADEGAAFDARVVEMGLRTIHVQYSGEGFVRRATPPIGQATSSTQVTERPPLGAGTARQTPAGGMPVRVYTPVAQALAYGVPAFRSQEEQRPAQAVEVRDENARMMATALTIGPDVRQLDALFERLDAPMTSAEAARHFEDMARAAEARAGAGQWSDVLELYKRIVSREATEMDTGVKRAVTVAIRRLNQPAMLKGVAQLLSRKGEPPDDATMVLSRYGDVATDVLLDLLVSAGSVHERHAYRAALAQCPSSIPALTHMLGDTRWYVVRNVAELLGEMCVAEADLDLVHTLRHSDARVRRAAAAALARLATPRSVHALQHALGDASADVRLQAALGLLAIRNPRSVPSLIEALDKEQDPEVQPALLSALGSIPTPSAVERLRRAAEPGSLLKRKPAGMRLHAMQALADAGTQEAIAALRGFANDREPAIQMKIAQLLAGRASD
ncbi:MAG: hypothetical protein MNPFHGCM_02017 [Gemmatimonadaceae bacterium]|nr:hypothetical protein [Gemmatimonadaceae bacterium]